MMQTHIVATVLETTRDIVIPIAAVLVTLLGLWLAQNLRRQMTLRLAETRREAYARLWEITGVAAPIRLDGWGDQGYLQPTERRDVWEAMTDWYYAHGDGMLLGDVTKTVYLNVKHNLLCETPGLRPIGLSTKVERAAPDGDVDDIVRGVLSIKQLSLLRTQLKSDLSIYGQTYSDYLGEHEIFFLEKSGVNVNSKPWSAAYRAHKEGQPLAVEGGPGALRGLKQVLHVKGDVWLPESSKIALTQALGHSSPRAEAQRHAEDS